VRRMFVSFELRLFPHIQAAAHVVRIDIERFTDVVERVQPEFISAINPFLGLAKSPLPLAGGGVQIPYL
jgi:hypothetical protein